MPKEETKKRPLVSVIVPCYNTAVYVEDTIQSLINQTYSNWEAVFVDDASPDNIRGILQEWVIKDNRCKLVVNKTNQGLAASRIAGIKASSGKYIFPLDSDDYIDKSYIEKAVGVLENDTSVEVVYADTMKFGAVNGLFNLEPYSLSYLLTKNCIVASAFFRKKTYDAVGGYCKDLEFLEDWDLWISILKNGGKVHKIPEALFFYRVRESGSLINTLFDDKEKYKKHHDIIFNRHREAFLAHVGNPILIKRALDNATDQPKKKHITYYLKNKLSKLLKK